MTIANGGGDISIDTPVFATSPGFRLILFVLVFAVMTALWLALALAHGLMRQPGLGAPIRQFGQIATPFVLIGIEAMMVTEAETVSWVTGGASRG